MEVVYDVLEIVNPQSWMEQKEQDESQHSRTHLTKTHSNIHQAMVDSGCYQTSVHQSLIQGEALGNAQMVKVRCVQRNIHEYPWVSVLIHFWGQTHSVED